MTDRAPESCSDPLCVLPLGHPGLHRNPSFPMRVEGGAPERDDWHHRCDIPACNCGRCHQCGEEVPEAPERDAEGPDDDCPCCGRTAMYGPARPRPDVFIEGDPTGGPGKPVVSRPFHQGRAE